MDNKYITVSQLNRYIKYKFDNDSNMNMVFLKGEISNFKSHSRGHLYFTIKDNDSRINAVMFQGNASKLKFNLEDGMKVLVSGRISVYESAGSYQIYVEDLQIDGVGNLYLEYEKLKEKLKQEGLFNLEHKRKIPRFPKRIGVITAKEGAAIKDIISTIKRRWPITEIILFPSLVQGKEAVFDIIRNINLAQNYDLDTLIVGRGGGSIEDLWSFNDETVARAIYNSKVPIISAVGHEIDFTIADFVADLRAPTPTGAAEMAVPNIVDFNNYIKQVVIRLNQSTIELIEKKKKDLVKYKESYIIKNPISIYQVKEQKFDNLFEKINLIMTSLIKDERNKINIKLDNINNIINKKIDNYKNNLVNNINKLEVLNPLNTIKRGYSITFINDNVLRSINDVKDNDIVSIKLVDGTINSKVINVIKEKE